MTNAEQKAARVLTRCGPFSERQAERYVESLNDAELADLVSLHEQHAANPNVHQGGRFNDLLHNVAERQKRDAAAAKEKTTDGTDSTDAPQPQSVPSVVPNSAS